MDAVAFAKAAKQEQRIKKVIAEPDSIAGLVTVPNLVPTGETITIPAGRTVVHPKLQVDGTLTVDGTLFIPSGGTYSATEVDATVVKQNGSVVANDNTVVHKTGDETKAGVLTLSDGLKLQGQNVSPFSGFKNYIINGGFDIWQRGTSQTTAGYGSDDRWTNQSIGSTKTHSQVACTDTERALFNASYFSRTVVSSVLGANNFVYKAQLIEDVTKLAGKVVTLSFWAKADSAGKKLQLMIAQVFGTGGSPSAKTFNLPIPIITLSTIWTKYTYTYTYPSIVGKTLGTDGIHTTYSQLYFMFDAGASWSPIVTLGQQSGTFDIAQVQLEEGSVATPFEQRPYGLELSLCQRYYEVGRCIQQLGIGTTIGVVLTGQVFFKTSKRIVPTVTYSDYTGAQNKVTLLNNSGVETNGVSVMAGNQTNNDIRLTASTTNTTQNGIIFTYTASAELQE